MTDEYIADSRPWAARKPQSYVMSGILIALAIALVWQGFAYMLAIYYTWYFSFRRFESDGPEGE